MSENWAEQDLKTIRLLMDRVSVYRRALQQTSLLAGIAGTAGALIAAFCIKSCCATLITYWLALGVITASGMVLMIRRQALHDGEPFWSPPTKKVFTAVSPGLVAGLAPTFAISRIPSDLIWLVACLWALLYGCAIHSAGFFMPRGIRLLGWIFIIFAVFSIFLADIAQKQGTSPTALFNAIMGIAFGGFHLAYGAYLKLTPERYKSQ